jgi:hypothetical protein
MSKTFKDLSESVPFADRKKIEVRWKGRRALRRARWSQIRQDLWGPEPRGAWI